GGEYAGGGTAQEDVGIDAHVGKCAGVGTLGVARLVRLHIGVAAFEDDPARIDHVDVFAPHAQALQQVKARDGGRTGPRAHQLHVFDLLADDLQAVQNRRRRNDGRAVLIVVKDGNLHAFAQLALDVEAFRCLDVFQVHA